MADIIDPLSRFPFEIYNGFAPRQQPKALYVPFDFTLATGSNGEPVELNLEAIGASSHLDFVQCVFIDNTLSGQAFALQSSISLQTLKIASGKQAYLPFLVPSPSAVLTGTIGAAATAIIPVYLLNVPMPAIVW